MSTMRRVLALMILLFPTLVLPNQLCKEIVTLLGDANRHSEERIQIIVDKLLASVPTPPVSNENIYPYYLVPLNSPETTFHYLIVNSRAYSNLPEDTYYALQLPTPGQTTPWSLLSPREKWNLMLAIEGLFNKGQFDEKMLSGTTPLYELIKNLPAQNALSPRRLLIGASKGLLSGNCRISNCAFSGVLYEIGATPDDIHPVWGDYFHPDEGSHGHMWTNARTVMPELDWIELDATPGSNRAERRRKEGLVVHRPRGSESLEDYYWLGVQHGVELFKPR